MPLKDEIKEIEARTGLFSRYQTTAGHAAKIPFVKKPAEQFLKGLGVEEKETKYLSRFKKGLSSQASSVFVDSFSNEKSRLEITPDRINRLQNSAKIYINQDLISEKDYSNIPQDVEPEMDKTDSGDYWQNLAVGICHVQEIDLLVEQEINNNGEAIYKPKSGTIDVKSPAILLLSSPALNFNGQAKFLSEEQQKKYIEGMFRNLFNAAQMEGPEFITLPAAGLGVFKGNPDLYFQALLDVAKEFPKLNIIYNPGSNENLAKFEKEYQEKAPDNLITTKKDVLFLADELTKAGYPCACHNPSDAGVVLGVYDVGKYWKVGKNQYDYVGEEHIGAMTTAPLNSKGLNPNAYSKPVIKVKAKIYEESVQNLQEDYSVAPNELVEDELQLEPMIYSTTSIYKERIQKLGVNDSLTQNGLVDTINSDIDKEIKRLKAEDSGHFTYSSKNKIDALNDLKSRISNASSGTTVGEIIEEWGNEKKYVNGWGQKESTATMLASHRNAFSDMLSPMIGSTTKTQQFVERLKKEHGSESIEPSSGKNLEM